MTEMARVLIVDDVAENISIVKNILKSQYEVTAATSGEKALEIVSKPEHLPDLILLDILMPDMDGFEVCKRLKSDLMTKDIPIIFLTVLDHAEDMVKGFEYGGVDYVTKPFEVNVLLARVNTHIQLKRNKDQLLKMLHQKDQVLIQQSKLALLGEMFESIMHQWKQPLSIISTSNSNIRLEKDLKTLTDESLEKMLDGIDHTVEHLSDTMNVFRDYLLVNTQKEYFSTNNLIQRVLKLLESNLIKEDIVVNQNIDSCEVLSYKNSLMQVLINIVSNAIYVLSKKDIERVINITASCSKENVEIEISDNGGGILEEDISKVFDKHFTTKKNKTGTGLGLYICNQIMTDSINGTISVENKDGGASFKIAFPVK